MHFWKDRTEIPPLIQFQKMQNTDTGAISAADQWLASVICTDHGGWGLASSVCVKGPTGSVGAGTRRSSWMFPWNGALFPIIMERRFLKTKDELMNTKWESPMSEDLLEQSGQAVWDKVPHRWQLSWIVTYFTGQWDEKSAWFITPIIPFSK